MLYILIAIGFITIYTTFFGGDTKNEYCFKVSTDDLGPDGEPTIIGYSSNKCTAAQALHVTNEMMKQSPHLKIVCTNVHTGEVLISNRPIQKGTQYGMAGILFFGLFISGCAPEKPLQTEPQMTAIVKQKDTLVCEFGEYQEIKGIILDSSNFTVHNYIIWYSDGTIVAKDTMQPYSGSDVTHSTLYDTTAAKAIRAAYWTKHLKTAR